MIAVRFLITADPCIPYMFTDINHLREYKTEYLKTARIFFQSMFIFYFYPMILRLQRKGYKRSIQEFQD